MSDVAGRAISGPTAREPVEASTRSRQENRANASRPDSWVTGFALFVLLCGLVSYGAVYTSGLQSTPARSDGLCHYVYLPAWVVYQDQSFRAVADAQFGGRFPRDLQIVWRPGTGRWLNAHQMGVAVLCLPFYLAGHGIARVQGRNGSGFSPWESHAAGLAGSFYLAAGLYLLGRLLSRHFPRRTVVLTLICITFGTNLFHYATYDSLWSHVFSFFLFAACLALAEAWCARPATRTAVAAGIVAGLIGLVRLPNLAFPAFFALYGVTNRASLNERGRLFKRRWTDVTLAAVACALVVMPQLAVFRAASGSWSENPYGPFLRRFGIRQAFDFASPHLLDVLFSPAKGLFFWSPILLFAFAGMIVGRREIRGFLLPALLFFSVQVYMLASWYDWELGGSFGHRGFTETLAALAIPLAAFLAAMASRPLLFRLTIAVLACAVALSMAQMLQYWLGILPIAGTTWAQYRSLFLRF